MGNIISDTAHVYQQVAQSAVDEIVARPCSGSTPAVEQLIAEHAAYKDENEQLRIKNEQLKKDYAQLAAQLLRLMNNTAKENHT